MEMQDKRDKMEKEYEIQIKNGKEEYKKMEAKYLEYYNQSIELQKNIDYLQNSFVQGTVKLNTELSELKAKVFELENNKRLEQEKYKELLNNYEKAGDNFVNIQKTMTKLREKDDFDITLIEERYIVLENMLSLEKNDLITQNRDLINQIKLYDEEEPNTKIDKNNNLKMEIKNLKEENKLLQNKLKDKESTIFQLQKKLDTFKILQQENQSLKSNIKENNTNFQVIIKELTEKSSQLSDELLESRRRTSLLRSIPKFKKEEVKMKVDNTMMSAEVEKYQKENQNLKKEIQNLKDENSKIQEDYSMIKAQLANDAFAKDNEIFKYKSLAKKYKTILEEKGLLKKK
jgi:cell division protein FtsB